jgi:hypothetical protein
MADRKINQLDPAGAITANDIFAVVQNLSTGEALQVAAADLRSYILGGANAGARIFFTVGVPSNTLGVEGDVAFDQSGRHIYQKNSGNVFVDKGSYAGAVTEYIRFNAVYGSGGLAADGLSYTNIDLINAVPISFKVEADELIPVETWGDTPLFDEFDFDDTTGVFSFGAALPAGLRITITYSI